MFERFIFFSGVNIFDRLFSLFFAMKNALAQKVYKFEEKTYVIKTFTSHTYKYRINFNSINEIRVTLSAFVLEVKSVLSSVILFSSQNLPNFEFLPKSEYRNSLKNEFWHKKINTGSRHKSTFGAKKPEEWLRTKNL